MQHLLQQIENDAKEARAREARTKAAESTMNLIDMDGPPVAAAAAATSAAEARQTHNGGRVRAGYMHQPGAPRGYQPYAPAGPAMQCRDGPPQPAPGGQAPRPAPEGQVAGAPGFSSYMTYEPARPAPEGQAPGASGYPAYGAYEAPRAPPAPWATPTRPQPNMDVENMKRRLNILIAPMSEAIRETIQTSTVIIDSVVDPVGRRDDDQASGVTMAFDELTRLSQYLDDNLRASEFAVIRREVLRMLASIICMQI